MTSSLTSPKTRRWLSLAAAVVVAGTLAACSTSNATEPTASAGSGQPEQIRIGYQAVPNGDLVVKQKKWLESAFPGTAITWTKFESGGDVNTAIIAGSIDIGLAGSSPVTVGLSEPLNIPYQVPWIFDVIGTAESLVVRNASGIADLKGLEGKKVATPFASTAHYSLLAALKNAGIDASKVKLVDLQPPDILAAWTRGDIDGAYVWSPTLDQLQKDGKTLVTSAEVAKQGNPTYDLAVVTKAFSGAYPAAVRTWVEQENRAVELLKTNPEEAATAIAAELGLTPAEALAQTKGLTFLTTGEQASNTYLGTPGNPGQFANGLLAAGEFLQQQGKIPTAPSLQTLQNGIYNQALVK